MKRLDWQTGAPVVAARLAAKGLTFKMGQTHVHRYMRLLLKKIEEGQISPAEIISHRLRLDDAPEAYKSLRQKEDHCVKVVMKP